MSKRHVLEAKCCPIPNKKEYLAPICPQQKEGADGMIVFDSNYASCSLTFYFPSGLFYASLPSLLTYPSSIFVYLQVFVF
jgi:hypothetical protein